MKRIDMEATGRNIQNHMDRMDFTQKQLGEATGYCRSAICAWTSGSACPSVHAFAILTQVFGCGFDDIIVLSKEDK